VMRMMAVIRTILMWLNCNLDKVNLDTILAGHWFCGVATGSARAYM